MDIQAVGWGGMYWIALAQDMGRRWAHVNPAMDVLAT